MLLLHATGRAFPKATSIRVAWLSKPVQHTQDDAVSSKGQDIILAYQPEVEENNVANQNVIWLCRISS